MAPPSATTSLGSYLRALREDRPGPLDAMAIATRISVRQLQALEAEDFEELPSPVFVKGFIRAYCQYLGVDSDEALARYRDLLGEPQPSELPRPTGPLTPSWASSPIFISLLLLVVFGGGLLALNIGTKRGSATGALPVVPAPSVEPSQAPPDPRHGWTPRQDVPIPAVEAPKVAAAPTAASSTDVTRPIAVAPGPTQGGSAVHHLSVKVVDPTWLRLQIDDDRTVEEMLPVGATREWTAKRRFTITVGNAGGIELMLNGEPVPSLGGRGAVIRGLQLPQATPAS